MNDNEINEKFKSILEATKEKINKDIVSNPKFDEYFLKELNFIYSKTKNLDIKVYPAFDNNSVSIISSAPLVDCAKIEFNGNNRNMFKTTFYLKNGNLFIDYDQVTLIDKKELEKANLKPSTSYESKLESNYYMRCFNKDGVEYSNNSYIDCYLLDTDYNTTDLNELVSSSFHKPVFSEYDLPKESIHILNATVRNTYRKVDDPDTIYNTSATCTRDGYKNIVTSKYKSHEMFPDLIRGGEKIE